MAGASAEMPAASTADVSSASRVTASAPVLRERGLRRKRKRQSCEDRKRNFKERKAEWCRARHIRTLRIARPAGIAAKPSYTI
jgi:hypothetical protein